MQFKQRCPCELTRSLVRQAMGRAMGRASFQAQKQTLHKRLQIACACVKLPNGPNETSRNNEFNIDGKMLIFPCFILLFADLTVAENSNSSKKVHWLILHYHKTGGFQFSLQFLLPSIRVRTSPFYNHLMPFHFSSMVACMFQVMI